MIANQFVRRVIRGCEQRNLSSPVKILIEQLEPRNLFSASPTLTVALSIANATVHEGQTFSSKITVTNTGQETISSVTPRLTQPTGSLVQAKYHSPTVASIAPGKSAIFIFSTKELVLGTYTLTANATTPFGSSTGGVSTTMMVVPQAIRNTSVTDASGNAYLKVGKGTVPIQVVDRSTGKPITGLTVALAGANRQNSRAVLVTADSQGRYPLQMIILQGAATQSASVRRGTFSAAAVAPVTPVTPTTVDISSGAGTALSAAIGAIETDFLAPISAGSSGGGVAGAFTAALKALTTSRLPLPLPFIGAGAPKTLFSSGPIHVSDSEARLAAIVAEFTATASIGEVIMGGLELITAGEISLPLAAVMLTSDFSFATASNILFDETDVNTVNISVQSCGGFPFIMVTPILSPGETQITFAPKDQIADVTLHPQGSGGKPVAGGSYELISKDDLGRDIVGVLDTNGSANIPVELGDYQVNISSPGFQTYSNQSLHVGGSGATVNPGLTPEPIASGTLTSALGQATGFLDSGTQYYLTPHFFDANGNEIQPVGPVIFQVHNPVGAVVATVDPNTGLVTMGPGFGAALVTAWCDGVSTTAKLVSTNGSHKYPVQPPTPFAVSPGTLHFTAVQGGPNPAAQQFDVVGLSSNFSNYHYTNKNGWLTVAPANVSGFNVFNVSVDVSGLSPGTYSLPVNVSDDNSPFRQSLIVSLTVVAAPTPTLAGTYSGNWTYPVFGFGDDHALLTWHIRQSGNVITGSYTSVILDGSVDNTGDVNTDTFTGTINGNSIVLNNVGGSSFFGTISGNTIIGSSNYLEAQSSFTLTAQN